MNRRGKLAQGFNRLIEHTPAQRTRSCPLGCVIALIAVGLALGIRELLGPPQLGMPFVTFFPAATLTTILAGFWPGMLASVLGALLGSYLYMPPYHALPLDFEPAQVGANLVFLLDQLLVCGAVQAMHNHYRAHRQANQRLMEKARLLEALVESTDDVIFAKDQSGRYQLFNRAASRFSGKTAGEVLGRDDHLLFAGAAAAPMVASDRAVIAERQVASFEQHLISAAGRPHSFLTTKGPLIDADGGIIGVFGISRDITRYKQAEQDLHVSEIRYRSLFENMQEGLAYCRMLYADGQPEDFVYLDVNPAFARLTGLQDVVGKTINDIWPKLRTSAPEIFAIYGRVAAGGGPERFEAYLASVDKWFAVSAYSPAPEHFVAVFDVITERKRVERKLRESREDLRRAQAVAQVGSWRLNVQRNELLWSDENWRIFGLPQGILLTYETFLDCVHPEDRDRVHGCWVAALRGAPYDIEHRILAAGRVKWVRERATLEFDVDGNVIGGFGTTQDITAQHESAQALEVAKAEAERANSAKSRFLAAASHDLRQPLSSLALYMGVLKDKLPPQDAALWQHMQDCVASLSEMLSDLLDLSKLEAGVVTPEARDFPLSQVLTKVVSAHWPQAQAKGLALRIGYFDLIGRTDPMLLERILSNLVANAIRYTGNGGVLIGCRRRDGRRWIEVWDTGVGIPVDKTTEIFEEFKQLDNPERSRHKGSGLGLAIVSKTAALLGLRIRVRSRLGHGSLFAVELPLGQAGSPRPAAALAPNCLQVAVVEDDAEVRQALAYALAESGHQAVMAANGAQLIGLLGDQVPDVLISDYRLADGETGYDVIRQVHTHCGAAVPAVIITGDTDPQLIRQMAAREILVLHKPLSLDALRHCLAQLMSPAP